MGGSRSASSSTVATSTTTTSVADSYNRTVNRVANLSDVGNVSVNLGGSLPGDEDLPSLSTFLPIAIVGMVAVIALMVLRRSA